MTLYRSAIYINNESFNFIHFYEHYKASQAQLSWHQAGQISALLCPLNGHAAKHLPNPTALTAKALFLRLL